MLISKPTCVEDEFEVNRQGFLFQGPVGTPLMAAFGVPRNGDDQGKLVAVNMLYCIHRNDLIGRINEAPLPAYACLRSVDSI